MSYICSGLDKQHDRAVLSLLLYEGRFLRKQEQKVAKKALVGQSSVFVSGQQSLGCFLSCVPVGLLYSLGK